MEKYEPKKIEPKWQNIWEETKLYQVSEDATKPKYYELEFFPYPSGSTMHVGHVRNYVISDTFGRYKRMGGYNVLHPMGWDAFGLPAENYAIKTGIPPQKSTAGNIKVFKRQLAQVGLSYDWSREINSSNPDYYKWTQWIFLLLYKRGLAYHATSLQWWCDHDQTVLANEQVVKDGNKSVCERCGNPVTKKKLPQWFFKITAYADRLLSDLDDIDWPEGIKAMQRNWIGRSVGAEIEFKLRGIAGQDDDKHKVTVFTTRADTLGGATFMVVSPELANSWLEVGWKAPGEVTEYIEKSLRESELERMDEKKEKTGVDTGITAINPLTKEEIPVWVADYVLGGYGTGAIMAVPAHDQRDYEFARKFDLPIRQVVQPVSIDTVNPPREEAKDTTRNVTQNIIYNPKDQTYLTIKWKKHPWHTFVTGGIEDGEDIMEAAKREITEETGYKSLKFVGKLPFSINSHFYAAHKHVNRDITMNVLKFELENDQTVAHAREDYEDFDVAWVKEEELKNLQPVTELPFILRWLNEGDYVYTGEGKVVNSGKYDGLNSSEARESITADFGNEKVNYKMRDWLISRQRYWGAPIPMIHCAKCGIVPVPEQNLPVELPEMESFQPSGDGRSPLARAKGWLEVECPECGGPAERETDTMDGFACSSWYFLRFADPHNTKEAFAKSKIDYWLPVDTYIGGAEHAVMHLLYARFWTKVLQDEGLVDFGEPFKTLRNQGMIGGPDGRKMSKRYGNVVTPDDVIEQGYGADALRLYELFIGPYDQGVDWSSTGIDGTKRFLNRVWALAQEYVGEAKGQKLKARSIEALSLERSALGPLETALASATHRALKKVTTDIEAFGFNTAIAGMMELVNEMYKIKTGLPLSNPAWKENLEILLLMLAPFAPHITEELWQQLGHVESVHVTAWPAWDEKLIQSDLVTIAIQVNGKLRGTMEVESGLSNDAVIKSASEVDSVRRYLRDAVIVKQIAVPDKLVNFVVKS